MSQYKISFPEEIVADFPLKKEEKPPEDKCKEKCKECEKKKLPKRTKGLIIAFLITILISISVLIFYRVTDIRPLLVLVRSPPPGCIPEVQYVNAPVLAIWGEDVFEDSDRPIHPLYFLHYGDPVEFDCQWHFFSRPKYFCMTKGSRPRRFPPRTRLIRVGYDHKAFGVVRRREGWVLMAGLDPD